MLSLAAAPALAQTVTPPTTAAGASTSSSVPPSGNAGQRGGAKTNVAQTSPTRTNEPEQIVVTANRRRELQRNVANSVTAISGKELDRKQEVRLQDLLGQVPGLSIEAEDKTAVRIVLRGINTGGAGATVGSVLDDVPINTTGSQNNASTNTPNLDTYDLQRIEVLRGPQSSLYGATAEGGLIKYVTNTPDPRAFSGEVETGVDGTTDGGIGGTTKGFVNVPFWDGKAAVRLTAWNEWFPGYIDDPEMGKTDVNASQQYGWRASVLVQPTPDLTVRLTAERQSLLSDASDDIQVVGAAVNPATPPSNQLSLVDGLTNNTALPTSSQNESAIYYGTVDYDLHVATLTSVTSFSYNNFESLFDETNTNLAPGVDYGSYIGSLYGVVPSLVDERQNSNTDKFNQEVRLASDPGLTLLGRRLDLLGGAYYTHETSTFRQFLDAQNPTQIGTVLSPPLGGAAQYGQLSDWAVFGQFDYYLLRNLDVALGGRFSGTAQHAQTTNFGDILFGPGNVAPQYTSNDHDALYSFAPRWRLNDNTLFYGRIATGYRPGGPNLAVAGLTDVPSYQPDRTVNYEIGWRQDLFNKTVSIDLTGFYIDWKNVQVLSIFTTPQGEFDVNGNAGAAVSKGVEWSFTWLPLRGLRLNATGDYTDARLTANARGLGGVAGDYLPYVPDVSTSINVDYSWHAFRGFNAYVSGTWTLTGERYTDFSSSPVVVSHALLPSYNTGAIRIGLENKRYGLEAFFDNIGDERGITFYGSEGGAGQTGQASIIQPRTIGLTARVKF